LAFGTAARPRPLDPGGGSPVGGASLQLQMLRLGLQQLDPLLQPLLPRLRLRSPLTRRRRRRRRRRRHIVRDEDTPEGAGRWAWAGRWAGTFFWAEAALCSLSLAWPYLCRSCSPFSCRRCFSSSHRTLRSSRSLGRRGQRDL